LPTGPYYEPDTFLWLPAETAWVRPRFAEGKPHFLLDRGERAFYYTAVQGSDDKLAAVKEALGDLGFSPEVFKKPRGRKSKGVDLTIAKDLLGNAYVGNYDVAILVAGDGDYVPLVTEAKRFGRIVTVAFFADPAAGLSQELTLAADGFAALGESFLNARQRFLSTGERVSR
jgi:uncharacterized LabA/DUF88 family protein